MATLDFRDSNYVFPADTKAGPKVRCYALSPEYANAEPGDIVMWRTQAGDASGIVTEIGWEDLPNPTFYFDVLVEGGRDE